MPRLSRTQKFADFRDQLSNDKEENINSQDLSSYQNKLNNFQSDLGNFQQANNNNQQSVNNYQNAGNPAFQNNVQTNAFNGFENVSNQNQSSVNNYGFNEQVGINSYMNNQTPAYNQSVETPAFNNQAFNNQYIGEINKAPEVQNTFVEQPTAQFETPFMKQTEQYQKPIEQVNAEPQNQGSFFFDNFLNGTDTTNSNNNNDFNSYFESNNFDTNSVFNDIKDNSDQMVSQKERDTYLNQAISDANSYNINNGQQTINSILDNSINEVRHNDVLGIDEDEFTNTVSMEINKIMDEVVAPMSQQEAPSFMQEPIVENKVEINQTVVEEKAEEVVEIKNINEIKNEPVNTMSNTIPFVVAAEDEEVLDEDEEDGSNTVLNVILIVLIIVLVAVLGLIVFYILKTKGIL